MLHLQEAPERIAERTHVRNTSKPQTNIPLLGPPQINFAKLAEIMNYKNAATASACFGPVKKKLLASSYSVGGSDGGARSPAPKTPKKKAAGKGKGKGKRVAGDDDEEDEEETPVAKTPKKKMKKAEAVEEGDDEGQAVVKGEVEDDE